MADISLDGATPKRSRMEAMDQLRTDGGWRPLELGPYGDSLRELEKDGWVELQLVRMPAGNRYLPRLTARGAVKCAYLHLD